MPFLRQPGKLSGRGVEADMSEVNWIVGRAYFRPFLATEDEAEDTILLGFGRGAAPAACRQRACCCWRINHGEVVGHGLRRICVEGACIGQVWLGHPARVVDRWWWWSGVGRRDENVVKVGGVCPGRPGRRDIVHDVSFFVDGGSDGETKLARSRRGFLQGVAGFGSVRWRWFSVAERGGGRRSLSGWEDRRIFCGLCSVDVGLLEKSAVFLDRLAGGAMVLYSDL